MRRQLFITSVITLWLLLAAGFPLLLVTPQDAAAHDCACLDGNGDDLCGDVLDTPVPDSGWLSGPSSFPGSTFVVPTGCDHIVTTAPSGGIRVSADRVVFDGRLISTPNGGEGVLFIATNACVVSPGAEIESGGLNKLSTNVAGNEAIAKSSVAFKCGTTCDITQARLRGNPVLGSGKVGIKCEDDIRICGSTIRAAGINIQSNNGKINASVSGALGGPTIGEKCDDLVANQVNGAAPPGNGNGIVDAADFPCQVDLGAEFPGLTTFNNQGELTAFCAAAPVCGPNLIEALNNPLIMISKLDLNLSGQLGNENRIEGRFRVTLGAEDGDIDTSDTFINNTSSPPGGAKIWLFANPASVNRLPVDKEDFLGPSSGTTDIASACYESPNPVQVGQDAGGAINLTGVPDPPPCAQNVNPSPPFEDFVGVLNGIF